MIFEEDLTVVKCYLMKQFPFPYMACNPFCIRWCLICVQCMGRIHSLSCLHVMHHSTNTDVRTHSWNQCGPFDFKYDLSWIKNSPQCICGTLLMLLYVHFNISVIHLVVIMQVISHSVCCKPRAAQCPCQTH